jgi:hypothetical protein
MATVLQRWQSTHNVREDGAVDSVQSALVSRAVVGLNECGAARLGHVYWRTVEASTGRLFRIRAPDEALEIRLLRRGPILIAFGRPELSAVGDCVTCRYPITGGLLARRPAGSITLTQSGRDTVELSSRISGFVPRLAAKPGRPPWTGTLYEQVQSRIHVAISRRYFSRLARGNS